MEPTKVTASEFQQSFGSLSDKARHEPVIITKHGRDSLVIMAAEEWERLKRRDRRVGLAAELLAVRDGLELGVRNGATADAKTLLAGQEATLKLLDRTFDKFSVKQLDPAGQRFDPNLHEAVLMQESGAAAPNTVLQVVQPGYELKGRLLRPARVIVAKAADG